MPKTVREKRAEAVNLWVERFDAAYRMKEPELLEHQATINAYLNKGPVFDPFAVSVKTGRLMKDLETITPRDVRALLGSTPYFPYEAGWPSQQFRADAIKDVVDHFTTQQTPQGDFYTSFTDALHMCRPFGKAYMWPQWSYWPVSIYERQPEIDPVTGQVVGIKEFRSVDIMQAMTWGVLAPWQVFYPRHGETLNEKPWIIIQLRVHKNELLPRLDRKIYKLWRKDEEISWGELMRNAVGTDNKNAAERLRRDSGGENSSFAEDVGTLLICIENPSKEYPAGRETHIWNYDVLLFDEDRSDWNMPLFIKPIVDLTHIVHIGPDKYSGIGLWQIIRDRVLVSEEAASMFVDFMLRSSVGTLMYNSDILSENQIMPVIGGRIPVAGGDFDRAAREFDFGKPPEGLLKISEMMDRSVDESDGINDFITGAPLDRKELATTVTAQSEASQVRVEHTASFIERTALYRMGAMNPKIIDRHMTDYHKAQILGPERARMLLSVDPDQIPGKYRIRFAGSDRVRNREQRFNRVQQMISMLGPQAGPRSWELFAKEIARWAEFKEPDVDQISQEVAFNIARQMGLMQQPPQTAQDAGMTMQPVPENAMNTAMMQSFAARGAAA